MKILIIEDQEIIRKLIRMTLKHRNDTLEEVDKSMDALPTIRNFQPDLIILDIMLPGGLDGFDICRKIKQDPKFHRIPVIMLTAKSEQIDQEEGHFAGADHYLIKPFSPVDLLNIIENFENSTIMSR